MLCNIRGTDKLHWLILLILTAIGFYSVFKSFGQYMLYNEKGNRIIIAFGDSLTEGLHSWPKMRRFHPYTKKLQDLINSQLKGSSSRLKITVKNYGLSGERLTQTMKKRLKRIIKENKVDLVIILAGTNDLVDWEIGGKQGQLQLDNISNDLQLLHLICYYNGGKTAAISIPETKFDDIDSNGTMARARQWVNTQLKLFVHKSKKNTVFIDISSEITRKNNSKLWDDGLHMTPMGYNHMGERVFQGIKKYTSHWIDSYDRFFDK